jgi:hypothetical protein
MVPIARQLADRGGKRRGAAERAPDIGFQRVGRWITITLRRSVTGSCMNSRVTPPDIELVAQAMQEYRRGSMSIVE